MPSRIPSLHLDFITWSPGLSVKTKEVVKHGNSLYVATAPSSSNFFDVSKFEFVLSNIEDWEVGRTWKKNAVLNYNGALYKRKADSAGVVDTFVVGDWTRMTSSSGSTDSVSVIDGIETFEGKITFNANTSTLIIEPQE